MPAVFLGAREFRKSQWKSGVHLLQTAELQKMGQADPDTVGKLECDIEGGGPLGESPVNYSHFENVNPS